MTILRPNGGTPRRRVLYLNSYGMAADWRRYKEGLVPGHHLWGCLELVRMGYEVAMPEEPNQKSRFYNYRRQDFRHIPFIQSWLRRDDIVYSAHTVVFWAPLLASLGLLPRRVVSMLYARDEKVRSPSGYHGLLGLTPAAVDRARSLVPQAAVSHISWGADLSFYPKLAYNPQWFLSCGKTRRDFATLASAAIATSDTVRVINTKLPSEISWPANVQCFTGGRGADWQTVSYQTLIDEHYAGCTAALILIEADPGERFAVGFTQLLEAMALAKPVIVTRTGALAGEIDVEKEGCGLHIPPNDGPALARAMQIITSDPARARAMGEAGRKYCEKRYNINRYAADLHDFFEKL